MRIALLEDDEHIAELMGTWLQAADYHHKRYASGQPLINDLKRETFDMVVLDWMVPDIDGSEVLKWIRNNLEWHIPIIFVTSRDSEEDIVTILNLGADDYVTKPVGERELLARIKALARRSQLQDSRQDNLIEVGDYRIDTNSRVVTHNGEVVKLTQKEYELVLFLFRNLGRIVSRSHILESVWGHQADINTRTADTHISRIRNKLGLIPENGWRISAVYHHGYRLEQLNTDSHQAINA
jgi:DNA-binding response OmpR family regulator